MKSTFRCRKNPRILFSLLLILGIALPTALSACSAAEKTIVHAVVFTSPLCTFCKEILEHQLPPLIRPYEDRLELLYVDTDTEAGYRLYLAALEAFGVPRGVPIIFIGEDAVAGINIPAQFPHLVEKYLEEGGVDWPAIPGLEAYLANPQPGIDAAQTVPAATEIAPRAVSPTVSLSAEDRPTVRLIMFWQNGCPHCHEVLENVLPPLQAQYGDQLEILLIEIYGMEDVNRLFEVAEFYDIPRQSVGVPFLIIGDRVLIGSRQIPEQLPALIEQHLAGGGLDWPFIPRQDEFSRQTVFTLPTEASGTVHIVLFTTLDCHSCRLITAETLGPLIEQYGEQLQIHTIDIVTPDDVQYLYQVAAGYGVSTEQVDLPLVLIGDRLLTSEQMVELPALVEFYLAQGGVESPTLPGRGQETEVRPAAEAPEPPSGFALALLVLVLLVVALAYSLAAPLLGKAFRLPDWTAWLIPLLIALGMGVAAYLSYVETQAVEAICGPVGDCNAVQQSPYAKLFGLLPVGVFGLLGYLGLLATWLIRRSLPAFEKPAALAFWGMALFGVVFSIYLTWLEIFVIQAICLWCLTSAILMMLLLLLGTPPTLRRLPPSGQTE